MPSLRIDWGELRNYRIKRLVEQMKKDNFIALLLYGNDNVKYVTDYQMRGMDDTVLLLQDGEYILFMYGDLYIPETKKYCPWIKRIEGPSGLQNIHKIVEELELQKARIGIAGSTPYHIVDLLRAKFPNMELLDATGHINAARSIKSHGEIAVMEEAAMIADIGMKAALESVEEGKKEYEIAQSAESAIWAEGAFPFQSFVSSGFKTAISAENTLDKRIRKGELVMIDIGCVSFGYIVEFTRTIIVGKPTDQQKELYQTVFRANQEITKGLKPCASSIKVYDVAREIVKKAGFEWSPGYSMHGLGIGAHEWPFVGQFVDSFEDVELQKGMVLAIEPMIFTGKPEVGGVRLEDVVVIREDGPHVLTKTDYCTDLL